MKPDGTNPYSEEQAHRIAYLVAGFLRHTLSEKEHDELDEWMTASDENQQLFEELINPADTEKGLKEYDLPDDEAALTKIKTKLPFTTGKSNSKRRRILRLSIAASILLLAGAITIVLVKFKKETGIAHTEKQDLKAGGNKAILRLADGKTIDLADARNGLLDSTGGTDVLKITDGQLSYENNTTSGKGEHVLSTPAGGQYTVTLPDGTRVWLNASSGLTYPVSFGGKERVVELEGEGYFEVSHLSPGPSFPGEAGERASPRPSPGGEGGKASPQPSPGGEGGKASPQPSPGGEGGRNVPFIVRLKDGVSVEVLGTHFNVMAYHDEKGIETTLLEGKVILRQASRNNLDKEGDNHYVLTALKPGEQGIKEGNAAWRVVSGADVDVAVAWKNGKFQFKDASIESIMRQVARWYDAEIVYEGKVDYHFNATTIYRNEPLSKLLEVLEATNRVHFSIEGRKIVVRP